MKSSANLELNKLLLLPAWKHGLLVYWADMEEVFRSFTQEQGHSK